MERCDYRKYFGFNRAPVVGQKVTVIPLGVNIAPLDVKLVKAEKKLKCDQLPPPWWYVGLEPVSDKRFFDIQALPERRPEYPFDVCVIYPAVKFARAIKTEQLTSSMIPKGIALATVTAAIDLTNDGMPDALIASFCCSDPTKPEKECELICTKTFLKVKNVWKLINTSEPC